MEIAIAVFETECEIKQGLEPSKLLRAVSNPDKA
jgi:hypothetical protein